MLDKFCASISGEFSSTVHSFVLWVIETARTFSAFPPHIPPAAILIGDNMVVALAHLYPRSQGILSIVTEDF
jgi:hypothetical protein